MKTKSPEQIFTELLGECWHEIYEFRFSQFKCRKCKLVLPILFDNPTYSNPADILRKMKEKLSRPQYNKFLWGIGVDCSGKTQLEAINNFINQFITNAPALLQKAIEFIKENKK